MSETNLTIQFIIFSLRNYTVSLDRPAVQHVQCYSCLQKPSVVVHEQKPVIRIKNPAMASDRKSETRKKSESKNQRKKMPASDKSPLRLKISKNTQTENKASTKNSLKLVVSNGKVVRYEKIGSVESICGCFMKYGGWGEGAIFRDLSICFYFFSKQKCLRNVFKNRHLLLVPPPGVQCFQCTCACNSLLLLIINIVSSSFIFSGTKRKQKIVKGNSKKEEQSLKSSYSCQTSQEQPLRLTLSSTEISLAVPILGSGYFIIFFEVYRLYRCVSPELYNGLGLPMMKAASCMY